MNLLQYLFPSKVEKIFIGRVRLSINWVDKDNKREYLYVYFYEQGKRRWYEIDTSGGQYLKFYYGENGKGLAHDWLSGIGNLWVKGLMSNDELKKCLDNVDGEDPDPKGKEPKPVKKKPDNVKADGNVVPFKKVS